MSGRHDWRPITSADHLWETAWRLAAERWTRAEALDLVTRPEWPRTDLPDYPTAREGLVAFHHLARHEHAFSELEQIEIGRLFAKVFRWAIEQHAYGQAESCWLRIYRAHGRTFVGLICPL